MAEQLPLVLIVGVGSIGERHLQCFLKIGRCRVGFCEPVEARRREVTGRHNVVAAVETLSEGIALGPDLAVIATPAPMHIPMAITLAEAGVHLLIEKPLSTALDGIAELKALVDQRKLTVAVGYTHRCGAVVAVMHKALASGRFGAPRQIIGYLGQPFSHFRPTFADTYFARHAAGGGAIQDAMTHLINTGEWLVGPVRSLVCDAGHLALPNVDTEDTVHLMTRQGAQGEVFGVYGLNLHQRPSEVSMTVVCERATVRCEAHRNRWRWMSAPDSAWHNEPVIADQWDTPYIAQAHAFLDAIEGRRDPVCTLDEGVQTLNVNLAMLESQKDRRWIDLPA